MPKGNEAWRQLRAAHRRGPKRIQLQRPRKKDGIPALANPENISKIQIIQDDGPSNKRYMILIVFKQVFASMRLKQERPYTMPRNRLLGKAVLFKKVLDKFEHNDYILGQLKEMKLDNKIGKCLIMTGKLKKPDATFYITRPVIERNPVQKPPTVRCTPQDFEVM